MITFKFNPKKAAQAAAVFVEQAGGRMSKLKLIKLLYIADREALRRWERPITGDVPFSLDYGPILSTALNYINSLGPHPEWTARLSREGDVVTLVENRPPSGGLTRAEINLLCELSLQYKDQTAGQMIDITHEFAEWENPEGSAVRIQPEALLHAVGKTSEEISQIEKDARELLLLEQALGQRS